MNRSLFKFLLLITMLIQLTTYDLKGQNPVEESNYKHADAIAPDYDFNELVWSDECNTVGGIDTTKWFHQTKLPNGISWWNNEVQHYTNRIDNSFNDTAYMHIVAKKEEFTDQGITKEYTSARLNSKFAFTYGKVEIRAILPTGVGTWPAMWMLGKNVTENGGYWFTQGFGTTGWPACGEIDIMEHWGTIQDYVSSAMHTPSSYGGTVNKGGQNIPNASSEFHVYKLEWSPEKMVFSIDDVVHYTYNPAEKNASTWPFDKDQYLLLNIAIQPNIAAEFTESPMIIDYVRVYQDNSSSSIQSANSQDLIYYPNPFTNEITIDLSALSSQDAMIKIYKSDARLVKTYSFPASGKKIILENLDDLLSGVYIISFESNNKQYNFRMLK